MLVRYLIGSLLPEESRKLEEEYLGNESLYEELLAVETELLDSYARGELTGDEARVLKSHLLPHDLRQRLLFSHALRQKIEASHARTAGDQSLPQARRLFAIRVPAFARQRGWRIAVPAFAMLVVSTVSLVWLSRRPETTGPAAPNSPPQTIPAVPQSPPRRVPVASFVLVPGQRSSGETNTISLAERGGTLRLELVLTATGAYESYNVTLRAVGNPWSETFRNLTLQKTASGEPELVVELSSAGLPSDDYTASASGIRQGREEEFAGYVFRLVQP
jgi:hypothetical protein